MSDTELAVAPPVPDANASPEVVEKTPESEAESSTAVTKADENTETVSKVQSRFDELTKHRREAERKAERAERDAEYWREQALRQNQKVEPTKAEPISTGPKTLADFEYDEAKYQNYLFSEVQRRAVSAAEAKLQEQQNEQEKTRRRTEFERREGEFSKSVEDYQDVTRNPALPVSDAMAEFIAISEEGPALAYYLGRNIPKAEQIARLPAIAAAGEMGRIVERLAIERARVKEKPVSKAPAPPPKIEGNDSVIEKDPKEMTADQFAKWRKKFMQK